MHPALFPGPKNDEEIKTDLKEWLICVIILIVLTIVIALTQDFADDWFNNFIEWTCSFNGTLDVEALWEQIKNSIGMK